MVVVSEVLVRSLYLLGAVGVLTLLRKPLRYPDKPGSTGFVLVLAAMSAWLASEGLTYFVADRTATFLLYNVLLFSITVCFVGWILMAIEFATRRFPGRRVLVGLAAFAVVHFFLLWTNFAWLHELLYRQTSVVEGTVLAPDRGPLFWGHVLIIHSLILVSTALFAHEAIESEGLRRQQAAALAVAPVPGLGANVVWFTGLFELPYDLTPAGVAVGGLVLSWALYRRSFLEIAPIARRTVLEEMVDAVVILDDRSNVVDWNDAARSLFGVEDPSVGMPAAQFFEPVPEETLTEFSTVDRTETQVAVELDGRDRHVSVSISPIETPDANRLGRVVVVRDITDIKRREQQLVKQNEHLDEFAGIVSHDLQGPLMELRGNARRAIRTEDPTHVEGVLDAADRMDDLVDDLLKLARTGRRIETAEPVDLATVADAAWTGIWSPNADLTVSSTRTVRADPDRVQQLFENLFRNAVEHGSTSPRSQAPEDAVEHGPTSPRSQAPEDAVEHGSTSPRSQAPEDAVEREARNPPPAVLEGDAGGDAPSESSGGRADDAGAGRTVSGSAAGGASTPTGDRAEAAGVVRLTVGVLSDGFYVEDDGPGIPPEDRDRIFERGYTTSPDGTGLGLGIVRQIAGAHGWTVRVTDGTTGGARFEITGVAFEDAPEA